MFRPRVRRIIRRSHTVQTRLVSATSTRGSVGPSHHRPDLVSIAELGWRTPPNDADGPVQRRLVRSAGSGGRIDAAGSNFSRDVFALGAACEGVSKARRFLHAIGEQAPSPNARRC
jgi:hypothetical protein